MTLFFFECFVPLGIQVEKCVVHTVAYTTRIAFTQVTGYYLFRFRMHENSIKGTCLLAGTTTGTSISIKEYHS